MVADYLLVDWISRLYLRSRQFLLVVRRSSTISNSHVKTVRATSEVEEREVTRLRVRQASTNALTREPQLVPMHMQLSRVQRQGCQDYQDKMYPDFYA